MNEIIILLIMSWASAIGACLSFIYILGLLLCDFDNKVKLITQIILMVVVFVILGLMTYKFIESYNIGKAYQLKTYYEVQIDKDDFVKCLKMNRKGSLLASQYEFTDCDDKLTYPGNLPYRKNQVPDNVVKEAMFSNLLIFSNQSRNNQ